MKREVKVGIFAIVVLLVGWGVIRYLKGADVFSSSNTYYAYYTQVGGIQPASHVTISGVTVGAVAKVTLADDAKGVEVEFTVDKRYKIPVDSKASIYTDGIMGGKAIEIVLGNATEYVERRGTVESAASTDIMEMATTEIDFLNEKISTLVDGLSKTLEGVNALIEANTASLTSIMTNMDGLTGNVNTMLANEREHLEQALASLSKFSQSLGDNADEVGGIIDNMHKLSEDLAKTDIVAELDGVVNNLNELLAAAKDENGSVGKLLGDAALYDNLSAASNNLSTLLEDLKENPHRYINISAFGSDPLKKVEKAKAKAEKKAIKRADEIAEMEYEQKVKQIKAGQ